MQYYIENKEDLQYFVYGDSGISSADFHIVITKTNHLSGAERNIEVVEVEGRDGALLLDKGNYKPFNLELECFIDAEVENINDLARQIKKWLQSDFKFKKLILSDDSEYYYEASCINKLDIEEVIKSLGEFKLVFLCNPLRKLVDADSPIVLTKSSVINNLHMASKPYIKVVGSGDITININSQKLILKGVEGYIEVDTELYNCFKGDVNQNNKMYSDFPILEEGQNNISWEGKVTSLEILPRWVVL